MKIAIINSLYKPDLRGGAETIVAQQAHNYREQGHEVFVVATNGQKNRNTEKQKYRKTEVDIIDGVRIYRLKPRNLFSFYDYNSKFLLWRLLWLGIDIFNWAQAKEVKNILLKEKPDRVYTHNMRGLSYLLCRLIKNLKIQHYHTLHDLQLVYPSGLLVKKSSKYREDKLYNNFFLRVWYEKTNKKLFNSPDKVISPSRWLMDFYASRGFFKKSKKIVKPPVMPISYKYLKLNLNNNLKGPLKLLYVGQIEEHKGILFLLQTIKKLQITNYKLQIVGSGADLAKAKKLAVGNKNIIFHGHIPQTEIGKYYKDADITIVPSLTYENAPTVIFESFAFGTPVLASNIGGIPEFIEEGKTGWLFEAGDEEDLLTKLKNVVLLKNF